jgi:hypothetical protein
MYNKVKQMAELLEAKKWLNRNCLSKRGRKKATTECRMCAAYATESIFILSLIMGYTRYERVQSNLYKNKTINK